jgi:hypothetical protein
MSQTDASAPVAAESAQASTGGGNDTGGESRSLESPLDIAAKLERLWPDGGTEDAPEGDSDETPEGAADEAGQEDAPEAAEDDETVQAETQDASQPAAVEAPAGWGADAKAVFDKLPPELKAEVARRETERERFVNAKGQEAAEAKKERDRLITDGKKMLQQGLAAANAAVSADFAGVDWLGLQQADPMLYTQLQGQYKARQQAVNAAMQAYAAFDQQQQAQRMKAEGERIKAETEAVTPKLQALIGKDWSPQGFATDLKAYLKGVGAPDDHAENIGYGYQLELATKAMLYDRQEKLRAAAAQKIAAAPKMQPVRGQGMGGKKTTDLQAARNKIRTGGSSTENIVDALGSLGF